MPSILPVKQNLSEGMHPGWITVNTNNPEVSHLPPGKETTRGREALQLLFFSTKWDPDGLEVDKYTIMWKWKSTRP